MTWARFWKFFLLGFIAGTITISLGYPQFSLDWWMVILSAWFGGFVHDKWDEIKTTINKWAKT